jgi:hypothetical protein
MNQLVNLHQQPITEKQPIYPRLPHTQFVIPRLPAEWAHYEQGLNRFFPICTWCDTDYYYFDENGVIQKGNLLFLTPQSLETAQSILALHLEQVHRKTHIVSPFEPYGRIFEQPAEKVYP